MQNAECRDQTQTHACILHCACCIRYIPPAVSARGTVTRRADGCYAFVDITIELDVEVEPEPSDGVAGLVDHAERGCFVGNSFSTKR